MSIVNFIAALLLFIAFTCVPFVALWLISLKHINNTLRNYFVGRMYAFEQIDGRIYTVGGLFKHVNNNITLRTLRFYFIDRTQLNVRCMCNVKKHNDCDIMNHTIDVNPFIEGGEQMLCIDLYATSQSYCSAAFLTAHGSIIVLRLLEIEKLKRFMID